MAREELLSPDDQPEDAGLLLDEPGLRPKTLSEFVGQSELKGHLGVMLGAAARRREAADHLLFAGPPGLGKTTLANIIAAEMGTNLQVTSGPALERAGDLASILSKLEDGDVLFIDEIHRLPRPVEEVLYPAMEDFRIDVVLGKGPAARSIPLDLARFTLVGATTRTGLITGPLRDRFGLVARLDYYEVDDLQSIAMRAAGILEVDIDEGGAFEIARRSRGTPRIANRLLRQVRDYAEVERRRPHLGRGRQGRPVVLRCRRARSRQGQPSGARFRVPAFRRRSGWSSTLAISVSEPTETVEDVYEPYLIQQGL